MYFVLSWGLFGFTYVIRNLGIRVIRFSTLVETLFAIWIESIWTLFIYMSLVRTLVHLRRYLFRKWDVPFFFRIFFTIKISLKIRSIFLRYLKKQFFRCRFNHRLITLIFAWKKGRFLFKKGIFLKSKSAKMIPVVPKWYLFLFKMIPFSSLKRYLFKSKMMSFIFLHGKKVAFCSKKVPFWNQNQQKWYLLSPNDTFFYSKLYLFSP